MLFGEETDENGNINIFGYFCKKKEPTYEKLSPFHNWNVSMIIN